MQIVDSAFTICSLALAYSLVGINLYLTSKVLKVTDLTCDGSFAVGGCAYGALVVGGLNPIAAFIIAILAGFAAGLITSSLSTHLKMGTILSSMVTITIIHAFINESINFANSGANINLKNALNSISPLTVFITIAVIVGIIVAFFYKVIDSEYGLAMRLCGNGKIISKSLGIDSQRMYLTGIAVGNGLSAIAGALAAQATGVFSTTMGIGTFVFGFSCVLISERFFNTKSAKQALIGCITIAVIYRAIMGLIITRGEYSLGSEYSGLMLAVILIIFVALKDADKQKTDMDNV